MTSFRPRGAVQALVTGVWAGAFGVAGRVAPRRVERWASAGALRVMVVAPHPDDEVAGCAGVIALHRQSGDRVTVVHVTDGRRSGAHGLRPEAMATRRREEAEGAARILGVDELHWLGFPEAEWREEDVASALRALTVRIAPDVVYAPSRIDFHPEHERVARALARVLPEARSPLVRVYQVQVPLTAVLTNLVACTAAVGHVTRAALDRYETQRGSLRRCLRMRRYAGRRYGAGSGAEEFWQLSAASYALLHAVPPARPLVRTFRGVRSSPLSDPLAYLRGRGERARLASAVVGERAA